MDNIKRKYGYSYDHQHRLTAAYYQLPGTVIPRSDSYSTSYSYDENGNILSLKRNGKEDDPNLLMEIDDLDYTYDQGNRLLKVKDATNNPAGFDMNGAHTNDQYDYDDYGNLRVDPYKKISHISYNHLNLPVKITFTGDETIEYTYLADGTKLKKTAKDAESNTTTTEYRDGFQYKNNILEFFPHAEGYVKSTESVNGYIFNYVFTHTDHLGNIRIKYTRHPQTGEIRILEEDHYYPYGLTHEGYSGNHQIFGFDNQTFTLIDVMADETDTYKYKFNGMEWQDEFDVNVYDFGARNYDPALGRWMNIDPLSEMMRRHSPYNYAFNNPIYFIDPDGMSPLVSMASMQTSAVEFYDFSDNGGGKSGGGEPKKPEHHVTNTFQYDKNSAGNKMQTGTDTVTETLIYNTSSENDQGQAVYTTTVVEVAMEIDAEANVSDSATKTVKETITTMTNEGPKSTFSTDKTTMNVNYISDALKNEVNYVQNFKANHSQGLSPVQERANTMNVYTNAGFSVLTGGAGYYISGVRASMAFAGATSVISEMSGLSNMVNPEKIKRTKKIR